MADTERDEFIINGYRRERDEAIARIAELERELAQAKDQIERTAGFATDLVMDRGVSPCPKGHPMSAWVKDWPTPNSGNMPMKQADVPITVGHCSLCQELAQARDKALKEAAQLCKRALKDNLPVRPKPLLRELAKDIRALALRSPQVRT